MADRRTAHRIDSDVEARQERNLAAVERVAHVARRGAWVLIAVGVIAFGGWCWRVVRTQIDALTYSGLGLAYGDGVTAPSPDLAERIDLFVMSLEALVYSGLVIGAGIFLRLAADHVVVRTGGSLPRVRPRQEQEWPTS